MKVAMFAFIIIAISILFVLADNNIKLNSNQSIIDFSFKYLSFIGNFAVNLADITGYVVHLDWKNYSG